MDATVKNLKENREDLICVLTEKFGKENLRNIMQRLLDNVKFSEDMNLCKSVEEIIEEMEKSFNNRSKKMNTADLLEALAENRGEYWDSKKRRYVKILA